MTAAGWLSRQAARRPQAPALLTDRQHYDYRALHAAACRLAAGLRQAAGDAPAPVASWGLPPWQSALLVHAAACAGLPFLPLDARLPDAYRYALAARVGAGLVVAERGATTGPLPHAAFDTLWTAAEGPCTPAAADAVQLLVATSGSSGPPKAVMLSGSNIAASVAAARQRLGLTAADRWLLCLPLHHIGGLAILHRCAEAGAAVRLFERFDAAAVWAAIAGGGASHISLVPAMLARLLEASGDAPPPPTLRVALVGGGPLSPALYRRAHGAGWPLCVSYGMTETASQLATDCAPGPQWQAGNVGRPLPGFEVRVVDAAGAPAAGSGRLQVRGAAVMAGYAAPGLAPGEGLGAGGWLTTGDLADWVDGRLRLHGRADHVLVSGGENVAPERVEALLADCPGVAEVGVTGRDDAVWGQRVVAVYRGEAAPEAVVRWCREHLPAPWRPRAVLRVAELPHTGPGKLDRATLRRMAGR